MLLLAALAGASDARTLRLFHSVDFDHVAQTYADVAAIGSRTAGSGGEAATFEYVERKLKSLGAASIRRVPFQVSVPDPSALGTLSVGNAKSTVYPLWPNLVRTSTCHVHGPLLYAGKGSLEEFKGFEVKGRIVLMEFDSGTNWRNAAKLGAAAVVFLQPSAMPRAEAEGKFASVPLDIPRFYVPLRSAGSILTAAMRTRAADLDCTQNWVERTSFNLIAQFPGSDPSMAGQPIELVAYADSMSVVPGLAPGSEAIGGIAGLLECTRILTAGPHARPLRVVLSGAHALALRGARELADEAFRDALPPLMTVTLDLSSGSGAIGSFGRGWFYEVRDEQMWVDQQISGNMHDHADDLATLIGAPDTRSLFVDAVSNGDNRNWKNNIPGKFALDCEPLVLAGMNAVTFRTIDDLRDRVDTPFDGLAAVKVSNVVRQVRTSVVMLDHLLNDPVSKSLPTTDRLPLDPDPPTRARLIGGYATVAGQVVSYDPNKSFIPDTKEPGTLACVVGRQKTMMGVRGDMVQYVTGPNAGYRFDGLATANSFPATDDTHITHLEAFHLDRSTGRIDKAVTWNLPGFEAYDTFFPLTTTYRESPIVVFPSVSVDLYDMVDPATLKALEMTTVVDARSGSMPRNYGIFEPSFDQRLSPDVEDTQVLFLLAGQRFQVISGSRTDPTQLILTNSTIGDEQGTGYVAPGGQAPGRAGIATSGLFPQIPLQTAIDIDAINTTRLNHFQKYRIISPDTVQLESSARDEIGQAQKAIGEKDWPSAARHGRAAWGYALRAHPIIMSTANDVVNGVVFYLLLLIPFSFFLERLLIGNQLMTKQLAWVVGIFVLSFLLLRLIHPAFEIVTNPSMIFIGFVMGALSIIVISFVLGKFESSMRAVKNEQVGVHEVDIRRSSVAMAAFNLGVSNMRRRKARTILTTLTLVIMTFIVLSFTSIVNRLDLHETPTNNPAAYAGLLMRSPGLDPMQLATFRQLANEFRGKATVVRRAYYYGADTATPGVLTLTRAENEADTRAMLGLDPDEASVLRPETALYAGRWFRPGERNVMVLPGPLADALKVSAGDVGKAKVTFGGVDYTVIGLADPSLLRSIVDLDGDGLMPADFTLSTEYQQQKATSNQAFRNFIRLDPSEVFIVPAETAMENGADLRSVAVRFQRPSDAEAALRSLMPRLRLNLYAGVPVSPGSSQLEVRAFSVEQGSRSSGIWMVVVQLLIAALFVLNTMIASVYERTREIAIFSSIGLAPNHISMLFFAESTVYGILGAVIGYFAAQATARVVVATGALPGLTLNFSSTSAVMSGVIVMAVVLGSTVYPARKAAKIAAPAMNEEVFQADPEGDVWDLPLPFSISATEAGPIARFLAHWLKSYEGYTIGSFVSADTELTEEPGQRYRIVSTTWLAPYDLGVSQRFEMTISPSQVPGIYLLDLRLTRLSGDAENWPIVNRPYLAEIRKQFLTWRTLAPDQRAPYLA